MTSLRRPSPMLLATCATTVVGAVAHVAAASGGGAPIRPSWSDVPALVASATAPVDPALRACVARLPHAIELVATRKRDGTTAVAMPVYGVGQRGFTPEERCLGKVVARIQLPPLPPEVERVALRHVIAAPAAPAAPPAFGPWRDLGGQLARLFDRGHRAQLAACDRAPRTVRLVLDLRHHATRVWLPAWQFHSPSGDGTTPPAERRRRACLTAAIRTWHPPPLPPAMAELEVALRVAP